MDWYFYINTLRKFWNFMEGLFPVLGRARERAGLAASRLDALGVKTFSNRGLATQRGQALKSIGQEFYWRDLSRERDIVAGLSPESLIVLRPVFLLSLALCLMLPLTLLFPYPAIAPSAISGAGGPVAGWSVVLWMLATALAWGCLLAGAGSANRPAVVLAADLYLFIMMIMSPVGSKLNFIPVLTALLSAAVCERRMKCPGPRSKLAGLIMSLLIGVPCGVFLWKSLPLWNMSTEATLLGRFVFGGLLGLLAFLLGRADDAHLKIQALPAFLLPLHRMVWTACILTLLFLSGLAFSMDFGSFAEVLLRGERYLTSFFWPAWYFIGVGIIFRLLRYSNTMLRGIQGIVRPSLFIPFTLMLLAVALAVTLSYDLIMFTDLNWWPQWLLLAAWKIYKATKSSLWENPMYSFSLELMTWVFVFDLMAVVWLAMKRMLNPERVAGLLFYTLLAWFFVLEYYFESFSLTRSNNHSILILFLFSIWLLWFIISLGLRKSTVSTPMWPASARIPAYGALLLFILLLFHARTAIRDFTVLNEFFYYLFRGIIDVGIPYTLYVYAGRRLGETPVPLSRLFAFFCLGGAITIPLAVMDKLAKVQWSWPALQAIVDAQHEQLIVQGLSPANETTALPIHWIAARAALVMAILLISAVSVKRTNTGRPDCTARVLFFVTALAMGLAAFSNTLIVLPFVPPRLELFYRPMHQSLMLDHDLFFLYLTYNIPALILVLSLTIPKGRFALLQAAGLVAAGSAHLGLTLIWPACKDSLLSTGLADTLVVGGIALFLLLIYRARIRLDNGQPSTAVETAAVAAAAPTNAFTEIPATNMELQGAAPLRPVVGPVARIVFIVAGSAILFGVAFFQWHKGHFPPGAQPGEASRTPGFGQSPELPSRPIELPAGFLFRKVPSLTGHLPMSAAWVPLPSEKLPPNIKAMFIRQEKGEWKPVLSISLRPSTGEDLKEILGKLEEELRKEAGLNYRRIRMEDWGHIFPGALAEDYHLDVSGLEGRVFHLTATTVLLPQADGTAAVLTIVCEPVDWEPIRAELIQTAKLFSASGTPLK
ncbi:MAG: hypothetical protein AB9866_03250 [Syntrophobacteraceae bacterium]